MSMGRLRRILSLALIVVLSVSLLFAVIEINSLNDKLSLRKSELWLNDQYVVEPGKEIDFAITPPYAGYLIVKLNNHPGANLFFYVKYDAYGIDRNYETNGYSVIPVLPVRIEMTLANLDSFNSATAELNVTYVY